MVNNISHLTSPPRRSRSGQDIGKLGEEIACSYLRSQGYFILGKNIKTSYQELDIVAKDRECLVFIEVKTRAFGFSGSALDCIDRNKMRHLKKAMNYFLDKNNIKTRLIRLDVMGVIINKEKRTANLSHFKEII